MWLFPINIGCDRGNGSTIFRDEPEWIVIGFNDTVEAILFEIEGRNNLPAGKVEMRIYTELAYSVMERKHLIWQYIILMNRQLGTQEKMWFIVIYEHGTSLSRIDQRHAGAA